ncbi:protein kinase STUNTED-like [Corylus avellana]|uniref:protein kinase STUNTED-like n=1 Tax=Corylus avellana TaxID=13451 RepID=UPI00286CB631|nr:protein kinase STUNTED-like [Corylus avellana]
MEVYDHGGLKSGSSCHNHQYKEEASLRSISLLPIELPEISTLGWPLLRKTADVREEALRISEARNMSVVEWVMSLPSRSTVQILQNQIDLGLNKTDMSFNRKVVNSTFEDDERVRGSRKPEDENFGLVCEYKVEVSSSSASFHVKESPRSRPGWPLRRIAASASVDSSTYSEAKNMSAVQLVMSLPTRSDSVTPQTQNGLVSNKIEIHIERQISYSGDLKNYRKASGKLLKGLELLISPCRWFSYKELNSATSNFSSENLIGEGGCSYVYKGHLPCGRSVAVKILKSYKEAWIDFYSEMNVISTLKHKHITSLIGVCVEDNFLISVYDFFPMGSLEENLHGHDSISVLPWEVRFKVAVAAAEALNYLHNECSPPVIHRDVKSSNILLSNEFQPQLSDFGLSIWGPTDSTHVIHGDVVGTFGYIAPEYFMRGRVSDKIDVYSLGVVLLELLSGRKPIGSETSKGQRSLVKWAKPLLESGDLKALLDPKLDGNFDVDQMHRMLLAASLCISQSSRLRPKVSQILKILTGEKDGNECVNFHVIDLKEMGNQDDDDVFLEFGYKRHMNSALLQTENDSNSQSSGETSLGSAEKPRHFMLKDYFKQRQD